MHRMCELGEELGKSQPNLEFKDGDTWKPSALISGRLTRSMLGLYREVIKPQRKTAEDQFPEELLLTTSTAR
jgi:hypothetical protein